MYGKMSGNIRHSLPQKTKQKQEGKERKHTEHQVIPKSTPLPVQSLKVCPKSEWSFVFGAVVPSAVTAHSGPALAELGFSEWKERKNRNPTPRGAACLLLWIFLSAVCLRRRHSGKYEPANPSWQWGVRLSRGPLTPPTPGPATTPKWIVISDLGV